MKKFAAITSTAAALFAFGPFARAAEKTLTITDFDRMRVEGSYSVEFTTARSTSGRLTGSRQALDRIKVDVKDRTLIIRPDKAGWQGSDDPSSAGLVRVRVTAPGLKSAWLSGSGSVTIAGVRGPDIRFAVSGSGSLNATGLNADRLTLATDGAGSVTIAGRAAQATVTMRGSGTIDATGLLAQDLRLTSEGSGNMQTTASRSANVSASGTGNVVVTGRAACVVNNLGAGTVSCGAR
jgi:Putative auto-transporter adhesin, head GIN domain